MIIYPAIDLQNGKVVRLHKGDMTSAKIYNDNPVSQARKFEQEGFEWVHIVDLDGAAKGKSINSDTVRNILETVKMPVQLGGGIRSHENIAHWISAGVSRVILGTIAVQKPNLVINACKEFPGKIAVGIDARKGWVATQGWMEDSNIKAIHLAKKFEDAGVAAIIYTDIDRDGTGQGLNMNSTIELAKSVSIPVIASGGVGSLKDLEAVKDAEKDGVSGVILGKAYYDGKITPTAALQIARA